MASSVSSRHRINNPVFPFESFSKNEYETINVELTKPANCGLGLCFAPFNLFTNKCVILVKQIVDGYVAQKDGRLRVGDHVLEVNSQSLLETSVEEAITILGNLKPGTVKLKIKRMVAEKGGESQGGQQLAISECAANESENGNDGAMSIASFVKLAKLPSGVRIRKLPSANTSQLDEAYRATTAPLSPDGWTAIPPPPPTFSSDASPDYLVQSFESSKIDKQASNTGPLGLGAGVEKGTDIDASGGVHVKTVLSGGAAELASCGVSGVQEGYEVLEINGQKLSGLSPEEVVRLFKEMPSRCEIVVNRARNVETPQHVKVQPVSFSRTTMESSNTKDFENKDSDSGLIRNNLMPLSADVPDGLNVHLIELGKKDKAPICINLDPSYDRCEGLFQVLSIAYLPSVVCEADRSIQIGDYIYSVNGTLMKEISHPSALQIVIDSGALVKIVLLRDPETDKLLEQENQSKNARLASELVVVQLGNALSRPRFDALIPGSTVSETRLHPNHKLPSPLMRHSTIDSISSENASSMKNARVRRFFKFCRFC